MTQWQKPKREPPKTKAELREMGRGRPQYAARAEAAVEVQKSSRLGRPQFIKRLQKDSKTRPTIGAATVIDLK
jgi:hypothetical protein